MADTVSEVKVADELAPDFDLPSSRGFNAEASDVNHFSNSPAYDSARLLGCEISKDQDMAALRSCLTAADSAGMKTFQQNVESLESKLQTALMHAVNGILESLGKEAAAQIRMAERKASMVEQEHVNTKQQALAMMLRIKTLHDSMLVDAERRWLSERRKSQELDAKVLSLQDTIKRMKAELKRKGDNLEEIQRHSQLEAGVKPALMSPSEGISKKRKGHPQNRLIDVKASQHGDDFIEDECDDTATVLTSIPTLSPSADLPNAVLGRGLVQSNPRNLIMQEHTRPAPTTYKQGSPASSRRNLDEGVAPKSSSHRGKELNFVGNSATEERKTFGGARNSRVKRAEVEEDSSDQHDSSLEGPSQNAEKKSNSNMYPVVRGEDMEGMADGFLGLIALQEASLPLSAMQELQNGHGIPGKDEGGSDSSMDEDEGLQSRQNDVARGMLSRSGDSHHNGVSETMSEKTSKGNSFNQTMVLRRRSGGKRRGKQQLSSEKAGGSPMKDKESKSLVDNNSAETSALAKLKGGMLDAAEGSTSLMVESSRDSRRLMQGARQLLSLRKL